METTCAKQRCSSTAVLVKLQGRSRVTFAMTLCILQTPRIYSIVRFVDSYVITSSIERFELI